MFEVGFSELVLLFVIGLLVLGPEKLPKVARTLGGITRKARTSWANLKRSIEAEIDAEELKEPLKKIQGEFKSAVNEVNTGINTIRQPVLRGNPMSPPKHPATPAEPAAPAQTAESTQPVLPAAPSQNDPQ